MGASLAQKRRLNAPVAPLKDLRYHPHLRRGRSLWLRYLRTVAVSSNGWPGFEPYRYRGRPGWEPVDALPLVRMGAYEYLRHVEREWRIEQAERVDEVRRLIRAREGGRS